MKCWLGSHVNEKKKQNKNRKNLKIKILKKRKKKGLEKWRIGSFPQNLALIRAAVSEKPELMDRQRMKIKMPAP